MAISAVGITGFGERGIETESRQSSERLGSEKKPVESTKSAETKTSSNEKETLDEIMEAAEILRETTKGIPLKQGMGQLMVGGLVRLNREVQTPEQQQEAFVKAKEIHAVLGPFFGNEWKMRRSGLLGEACAAITLEGMTFVIKEPSPKDDIDGNVDLWADAKDGTIFAVQVKTSMQIKDIELHKIAPQSPDLGVPYDYRHNARTMIKYISATEEFGDKTIIPILIEFPGGEGNEYSAYNMTTGVPLKETRKRIEDLFHERIWND